jgi:hypothetical protein
MFGGTRDRQTGAKPGRGCLADQRAGKEQTSRDLLTSLFNPLFVGGTRFGGMVDGDRTGRLAHPRVTSKRAARNSFVQPLFGQEVLEFRVGDFVSVLA